MSEKSLLILRFSIAGMFLWFGFQQLLDASAQVFFLPEWFGYIPIPGEIIVRLNGFVEVLLAIMLILGVYVRIIAAFLALHLFMIAASIGGATGVRDLVLAISTGLLALNVPDKWTLDAKQKKETLIEKLIHTFVRK